jgi:hypothetical protein
MGEDLIKKISWTYGVLEVWNSDIQSLANLQKLENEGFGMLADEKYPDKVDASDSVVCPDGSIFTPRDIEVYFERKYRQTGKLYDSKDPEDVKIHKAQMYYLGFIG